jgi:hypothetical protein
MKHQIRLASHALLSREHIKTVFYASLPAALTLGTLSTLRRFNAYCKSPPAKHCRFLQLSSSLFFSSQLSNCIYHSPYTARFLLLRSSQHWRHAPRKTWRNAARGRPSLHDAPRSLSDSVPWGGLLVGA